MTFEKLVWTAALEAKDRLVRRFKIKGLRSFKRMKDTKEDKKDKAITYGWCDSEGHVRIRIRHPNTRYLFEMGSVVDTVCHELAHLQIQNHGKYWRARYKKYLAYIGQFL